jgi:4-hydroxy-3-polyprenylbenzoate decarboxylase
MSRPKRVVVGICGASGSIYGLQLLRALLARPIDVNLVVSDTGVRVMAHETAYAGGDLFEFMTHTCGPFHAEASLTVHDSDDLFAGPASGSFVHDGMAIAPCSMKTLGTIAGGISDTLIQRAADVCLKERRPLILVPRETPLNVIHLKNMGRVAEAGAIILPASPSFYSRPATIPELVDTVSARILDHLRVENDLMDRWGGGVVVS